MTQKSSKRVRILEEKMKEMTKQHEKEKYKI